MKKYMGVPVYKLVTEWRKEFPGMRALILISPGGASTMLLASSPCPKGKWRLLGVIE